MSTAPTATFVADTLREATPDACVQINRFCRKTMRTRGGRIGSGMGTLLEALWGYSMNRCLAANSATSDQCELAWMSHQYNDFACVHYDTDWNPHDRAGEFLRVEAKSMNVDADESKGHFDEPAKNLEENDLLLVLFWGWRAIDKHRLHPMVKDYYIGRARPIALLRDTLHMARGGSFVDRNSCPDKCAPASCPHHGEPLNAAGIRERRFGPAASQGKGKTQNAMNFGGLLRMVSASDSAARSELYRLWKIDDEIHEYLRVLYRNFPNKLTQDLLRNGLHAAGINEKITTKPEMTKALFTRYPDSGADWIRKGLYRP